MAERTTAGERKGRGSEHGRSSEFDSDPGETEHQAHTGADVKQELKETARNAKESAERKAKESVREGKETLSHKVGAVAHALHRVGDSLEEDGESTLARYGHSTADRVERFAGYLERKDVRGLVSDIENAARRNPGTFIATTFAAGLLMGRFLRSSSSHEEQYDRRGWTDGDAYPATRGYEGESWGDSPSRSTIDGPADRPHYGAPSPAMTGRPSDLESGPRGE